MERWPNTQSLPHTSHRLRDGQGNEQVLATLVYTEYGAQNGPPIL